MYIEINRALTTLINLRGLSSIMMVSPHIH